MFKNYIKSAYRNIVKNSFYSLLNILGLAIGIVCSLLILLYVKDELSFDKHHEKYERIYRVESDMNLNGKDDHFALSPLPMAPMLKDECPEIENYVRFLSAGVEDIMFRYEDKAFYEDNIAFVDSTLFDVFSHTFVMGEKEDALNKPYSMVVTKSFSDRYFGKENPIGKTIESGNFGNFTVTAVIKDFPGNSHMKFDCLMSVTTAAELNRGRNFNDRSAGAFWNVSTYSFVLLKEKTNPQGILDKFPDLYEKYMASVGNYLNGNQSITLTRLDEIHFSKGRQWDYPVGNSSYILIFSLVAIFILCIACINYMNMATARSSKRAKEVGIRKVLGAHKSMLVKQFLSESMLLAIIALIIALISIGLLLPEFNQIADKTLSFESLASPLFIIGIIAITLFVGFIAGSYPAFYLSSFRPVSVLKSDLESGQNKGLFRKILVVTQFTISVIMIICTLVVSNQQQFIKNKDLGYDAKDILVIPARDTAFFNQLGSFKEELSKNPNILEVGQSMITMGGLQSKVLFRIQGEGEMREETISLQMISPEYMNLMKFDIVEGRALEKDRTEDYRSSFIINETAARVFGWGEEALGKRIQFGLQPDGTARMDGEVIGVVKDFHYSSIHNKIEPFILLALPDNNLPNIHIRINPDKRAECIEFIRTTREDFNATTPMNYFFLEDKIGQLYTSERKLNKLFTIFSILTIFISCLGLLGLSSYVIEQRTKEIGIRKVLGSTNAQIVTLVSKSFLGLVLLSIVIASPIAWYFMDKWLQDFAYKISISPWSFIYAALGAFVIAGITVAYHSVKAGNSNPVDAISHD